MAAPQSQFRLRPYCPTDLPALYDICLRTGDAGADASALFTNPRVLGDVFAAPYAVFSPQTCFVLADAEDKPMGYILGVADTSQFNEWCNQVWFPPLRRQYPAPPPKDESFEARVLRIIHAGFPPEPLAKDYPAHLHIDLLPEARGQGHGRRLMQAFLDKLRSLGVRGVHLGVGARNATAIAFYERLGFTLLRANERARWYGLKLNSSSTTLELARD